MKKGILIFVVIIFIIAGALFAVPVLFKNHLMEITKTTINKHINARVEFDDFKLSLFQNFPKATIQLEKLRIIGKNEFANDTLISINKLGASMRLSALWSKESLGVEKIVMDQPVIKLMALQSGAVNWDLAGTENKEVETQAEEKSENTFELQLESIDVLDATLLYIDQLANMDLVFDGIDFDVSGRMYGTQTELNIDGTVQDFSLTYDSVRYISNTTLATQTKLDVDYQDMKILILENELWINKLALELKGNIEIPSDSMFFDLSMNTRESDFDNFLALVPPAYESYMKDITANGSASVTGKVNGLYFEETYPAFSLGINIDDGDLQYAGFPEKIKNIKASVAVSKPVGNLNLTEVNIEEAHAEIKNNPVDLHMKLNNLIDDPWFDGAFIGKINFDHLKDVIPMDSVEIAGTIDANLFVNGNYSAIEGEQYDKLKSDGIVLLDNFVYTAADLNQEILVPKGQLEFSPQSIDLSQLNVIVGQSDFNLNGQVSNYLNYFLKNGKLQGNLNLTSNQTNLNELLLLQKKDKLTTEDGAEQEQLSTNAADQEILAFDIPDNVDITFRSHIKQALFDRLPIHNINGLITARNGRLILNGLNMNMLDGELKLSGSYQNTPQNRPLVDFGFDVLNFDIPKAYQTLTGIRRMLPVAGHSRGKFSTNIKMKGQLSSAHKLIPASIDGLGRFNTSNLEINESPIFNQLRGILKPDKLKNVKVGDFSANYNINNGNVDLRPFKTTVAGQETTVRGTLSAENLLNMRLDFNVNRDAFGQDIQNILSVIPGNKNISSLPAGVIISGPVGKPEVKMDLSETRRTVSNATKDDLKNSLDKLGKGLKKLFEK